MISRRNLLILAFGGTIIFFAVAFSSEIGLCPLYNYSSCSEFFNGLSEALLPTLPLFIFSLITFQMRQEVYQTWVRFARWWIPLSMLAILIAPEYSSDWMYPIEKGGVALVCSAIFCMVSPLVIAIKYRSLRKGRAQ